MGARDSDGTPTEDPRASQHPVDRLIRELIATERPATDADVARVLDRMAGAPFDRRTRNVRLPDRERTYQGQVLGPRADALFYHLVKRVVIEEQWIAGTTANDYLADLHAAVRAPTARLVLYADRGGALAVTVTPTAAVLPEARRGPQSLAWLLVIYSADRGIIVTGYQFSTVDTTRIPREARWLR